MARHAQCMQNLFLKKHESSKNDGVGTPYTITVSPSSKKFLKKATNHFYYLWIAKVTRKISNPHMMQFSVLT